MMIRHSSGAVSALALGTALLIIACIPAAHGRLIEEENMATGDNHSRMLQQAAALRSIFRPAAAVFGLASPAARCAEPVVVQAATPRIRFWAQTCGSCMLRCNSKKLYPKCAGRLGNLVNCQCFQKHKRTTHKGCKTSTS